MWVLCEGVNSVNYLSKAAGCKQLVLTSQSAAAKFQKLLYIYIAPASSRSFILLPSKDSNFLHPPAHQVSPSVAIQHNCA